MRTWAFRVASGFLASSLLLLSACSDESPTEADDEPRDEAVTLHLAHFPNLTHAPALYGTQKDIFEKSLGKNVELKVKTFNAGTEVITAMFAEDVDIAYIGPNPAINGFQQSKGEAVRIIAGATSGGAALVVDPEITSPDEIKGKTIATPSLGNTQDVALRAWLAGKGLETTRDGRGEVSIRPQENAQTLETFRAGGIDGAWVPEPWASRLVLEGGGKVLLDEADLWPKGRYATTLVIARTDFLEEHPNVVEGFLKAHVEVIDRLEEDSKAQDVVNAGLEEITGRPLDEEVLAAAWKNLTFTYDPLIATIEKSAASAKDVDLLEDSDIQGIADLSILDEVLDAANKEPIDP